MTHSSAATISEAPWTLKVIDRSRDGLVAKFADCEGLAAKGKASFCATQWAVLRH